MRNKLFYVALAYAGVTFNEFAKKVGVSRQAIHQVLIEKLHSDKIETAIANFTASVITELYKDLITHNLLEVE